MIAVMAVPGASRELPHPVEVERSGRLRGERGF
jgi:hypothetical protein